MVIGERNVLEREYLAQRGCVDAQCVRIARQAIGCSIAGGLEIQCGRCSADDGPISQLVRGPCTTIAASRKPVAAIAPIWCARQRVESLSDNRFVKAERTGRCAERRQL